MSEPPRYGNIGLPDHMQILSPEDVPTDLVPVARPTPKKSAELTTIAIGAVVGALAIWAVPKAADFVVGKFNDYRDGHSDGFGEGSEPYFPDDGGPPFDMDVET